MNKEALLGLYQKYQYVVFPVLIILSSFILMGMVIFPQILRLLSNQQVLTGLNQKQQFLDVKAEQLENFNEEDLKEKLNIALLSLPAEKDLSIIVGVLQNIVAESGFNLITLRVGQITTSSETPGFTVKIELAGPYSTINQLLNRIESGSRVMKVSGVEINQQPGSSGVSATIQIDAFYSPLPSSLGAVDAPLPKLTAKDEELVATLSKTTAAVIGPSTSPSNLPPRGKSNPFE